MLLLLLGTESHAMGMEGTVKAAGKMIRKNLFSSFHKGKFTYTCKEVPRSARKRVKKSFFHTISGKILSVGLIACVVSSTLIGIDYKLSKQTENEIQEPYTMSAQIEEKYIESSGTSMRVRGTLTNNTEEDWTDIDLIFQLVDFEQEPVEVAGMVPDLRADLSELSAGETKEFVTAWFPAVLESDFDKVKGYHIEKFEYSSEEK